MQLEIIRARLLQGWGRSLGCQALLLAICLNPTLAGFSSEVDFDDEDYPNYPTGPSFGLGGQPPFGTDFLQSIPLPFDNSQISYASGIDGYPAFLIESQTNIRSPSKTFFTTNKLSRDFSLLVTVQPHLEEGGILFAVVNPEQTLISFGLELGQADGGKVNLTLYYQDHRFEGTFGPLVQFEVASFVGEWRKFAISMEDDVVTLFYGCEDQQEIYKAEVIRTTMELPLEEGSTLFVAQGGQLFGSHFVGAIQELKLFDDPERAEGHCKGNQMGYSGAGLLPDDGEAILSDQPQGESVVGPPGAIGPQGEPGPPGEYLNGVEDSIEGSGEVVGEEDTGAPGPQGEPGTAGKDGQPGERGPEGQKGEAGVRGPQGVQGQTGTVGLPGPGVSRVQLEQFCPAGISLQDVCRQLQPAKQLRVLLNNPYRDLVPDGNPSTLVTKLQADLAAILTVDPSRLDNFQVSSGTSMLSFEVRPPTSLNLDFEISVEDIVDLISTLVRTNMLDLQTAQGLRLEPDLTSYEVKDVTEIGQGSGSPGVPGLPGLPGFVGPRGDQGLPGQKGDTGDVGLTGGQGLKGEPGVSGMTGQMGPRGYTGPSGPPGPPGIYQEIDGGSGEEDIDSGLGFVPGKPGPPGRAGTPGKHGSQGIKGDKGDQGLSGSNGLDGTTGASGPQGLPGVTGSPGVPGLPGGPGVTGPLGARGQKGERGEPGYGQPGPPGPPGDISTPDSGIDTLPFPTKGEKGEDGGPGSKGDPGLPGLEGDPGLPGIVGPMGLKGETGETGQSVLVPVDEFGYPLLNVATLPSVKGQRGEPGQCTEECVTSVGPTGPQGPMGPQGQEGHPGVSGQRGLPGIMGEIGIPGLPAYKGSRGYPGGRGQPGVGLKGEKGEMGYAGPPGRVTTVDGRTVVPGHKGERGLAGIPGKDGIRGLPGVQGYQGLEGVKGDVGSRGFAGRRGHRGNDGSPGAPGREGPLGRQGVPGRTGLKGERGGQGPPGPPGTGGSDIGALVGVPGIKGEPGQPGQPGESIIGPPGPPGTAGDDYDYYSGLDNELDKNPPFIIGPRGPPGPPGPPGPTSDAGDKPDMPRMGGPVTFSSVRDMLSVSVSLPEATLAYIAGTQTVYVRVPGGWKEVLLGSFVPLLVSTPQPVTSIVPTTQTPGVMSTEPTAVPMSTALPVNIPNPDIVGDGQPVLRLVAANEPFTGDIRGIKGADYICYKEAKLSGLQGTFRAFVTSRDQDLRSLVHERLDRELPIVNLKREKLFYNWDDIYNGSGAQYSKKTPLYSFDGRNVLIDPKWPKKIVWHGSDAKGNRKMKHSCHGWRSRRPDEMALASSLLKGLLLEQTEYTCDHRFVLLCVEHVSNRFLR